MKRKRAAPLTRSRKPEAAPHSDEAIVPADSPKTCSRKRRRQPSLSPDDDEVEENLDYVESLIELPTLTPAQQLSTERADEDVLDVSAISESISNPLQPNPSRSSAAQTILESVVHERLAGTRRVAFRGCTAERHKIHSLVEQTVEAGEGNSLLVIGPRGSGKTRLVKDALQQVASSKSHNFHVVTLNGFIHTDDRLALREIWRQLGKELEANDEDESSGNYADTLAKLLAVLSHPAELPDGNTGMMADSVVFILDEFDLFATHGRQTLLYNLFDIAQSRKAPIAVLGLTAKVNVVEMLEKRVKSRFSHRYVYLKPHDTLASFRESCQAAVTLTRDDLSPELIEVLSRVKSLEEKEEPAPKKKASGKSTGKGKSNSTPATPAKLSNEIIDAALTDWNASMQLLLQRKEVIQTVTSIYYTSNSYPLALSALRAHFYTIVPSTTSMLPPDSKLSLLYQLPTLALTLLICAARLDIILSTDVCNFAMAYEEYVTLVARAKITNSVASGSTWGMGDGGLGGRLWSRAFGREAWSSLVELELLVPAAGVAGVKKAVGETEMVRCDVALEEIIGAVPELERGLVKWCKEI